MRIRRRRTSLSGGSTGAAQSIAGGPPFTNGSNTVATNE